MEQVKYTLDSKAKIIHMGHHDEIPTEVYFDFIATKSRAKTLEIQRSLNPNEVSNFLSCIEYNKNVEKLILSMSAIAPVFFPQVANFFTENRSYIKNIGLTLGHPRKNGNSLQTSCDVAGAISDILKFNNRIESFEVTRIRLTNTESFKRLTTNLPQNFTLKLIWCNLEKDSIASIFSHICKLSTLTLKGCTFNNDLLKQCADRLKDCNTLTALELSETVEVTDNAAKYFFKSIENNTSITNLNISRFHDFGDYKKFNIDCIADVLIHNRTLTTLDISANNLGNSSAILIAGALDTNFGAHSLKRLIIRRNQIDETAANMLLKTGLESIDFAGNNIANINLNNNNIKMLNLEDCQVVTFNCAECPELKSLDLSKNCLNSVVINTVTSLEELNISDNKDLATDEILLQLKSLNVKNLSMENTKISQQTVRFLCEYLSNNITLKSIAIPIFEEEYFDDAKNALKSSLEHNVVLKYINVSGLEESVSKCARKQRISFLNKKRALV